MEYGIRLSARENEAYKKIGAIVDVAVTKAIENKGRVNDKSNSQTLSEVYPELVDIVKVASGGKVDFTGYCSCKKHRVNFRKNLLSIL